MPFTPYNSSVQTSTTDYSPLQDFLKANNPAYANTNFVGSSPSQPTTAPQTQDNPIAAIGKDAFSTLLVKPAVRVGQAAAAPLVQEKMDSTTNIQQQQTDELNKVIGLLKTETDPTKKAALHDMALNLVKQATANTQAGQDANASDAALSGNTHILGQDIQGQEGGAAGVKQIAGDALKSASYLAAPELSEGAVGAPTAAGKIFAGAASGSVLGAAAGAGNELENPNSTFKSVTDATGQGMKTGALIGAAIPGAGEAFKGVQGMAEDFTNKTETAKPEDTLASRIKDATPEYNPKMVGKNVMTPDITDEKGNITKGQITPRIASEGKGLTGERPVTTSASEYAAGTELQNIKDYPDKGSALDKMLSAQKAIGTEAETMRSGLQAEDKANPLDATAEKAKVADLVKSNLPKDIQDKIGYISKDNPLSKLGVKDNPQTPLNKALQEMSASPEDSLPKTAAGRYYQKVLDAVKEYDGTREGKLNLRQTLDSAYSDARGKLAFGTDSQNALDETHTDIRDAVNKDLHSSTQNVDTQASLQKQTNLYRATDVLQEKAQAEASTHYGKFVQEHPMAKMAIRVLSRQGIMIPIRILESAAGLGAVYSLAKSLTKK